MTSIVLFAADWCPHCIQFKPTWEKIKAWCSKNGVQASEYEDQQIQMMHVNSSLNKTGIPLAMIDGYPTIIIKRGAGNLTKIVDRSESGIMKELKNRLPEQDAPVVQSGGGCAGDKCVRQSSDDVYRMKYYKYKSKYMELKNRLSN